MNSSTKMAIVVPTKDRPIALKKYISTLSATNHDADLFILQDIGGTLYSTYELQEEYEKLTGNKCYVVEHDLDGINNIYDYALEFLLKEGYEYFVYTDDDLTWEEPSVEIRMKMNDSAYTDLPNGKWASFDIREWDKELLNTMNMRPKCRAIMFCKPGRPSAWMFSLKLINELKAAGRSIFDTSYTSGYLTDDDTFLEIAHLATNSPKDPFSDGVVLIRNWVTTLHSNEGSQWPASKNNPNEKVFSDKWVVVDSEQPNARRRKGSQNYYILRDNA
jgi:glycosyltransferase involved in cell wall biosynthesis